MWGSVRCSGRWKRTMLTCSREEGNMVAVTDELLWCSCCINMADTWRFHMSTKYFPKTLLTIDLSVVKHLYYCKLRRNREVFNQILLSCSLAHVTEQWGRQTGLWWVVPLTGSLLVPCAQAATPPSCAWCAAGPWLRSAAWALSARMQSVSTAAWHKLHCFSSLEWLCEEKEL